MDLESSLIPIENYHNESGFDCLIVAISPEERCIYSFDRIMKSIPIKKCIVVAFSDLNDENSDDLKNWFYSDEISIDQSTLIQWRKNYTSIIEYFKNNNIKNLIIERNSACLSEIVDTIVARLDNADKIIFDTSCFPKNFILEIMRWIPQEKITCVYTRAIHDSNSDHHSIGVKSVGPLPGFEGDIRTRNNFLVVLLGFEGYRSLSLLDYNEPHSVLALIGDPNGNESEGYITQAKENNHLFLDHYMISQAIIPSISHPKRIAESIESSISNFFNDAEDRNFNDFNIYASVLGTKIQSIGLFLFWLKHKNVQLIYPNPSKRRIGTGTTGTTFIFQITKPNCMEETP